MAFNWLGAFRTGAWKVYREFVLNEQRDLLNQINVINAELDRIGKIIIIYETVDSSARTDINVISSKTERRLGFLVSPPTSSIGKLLQAYIAYGGNPFDMSLFLTPDIGTELIPAFEAVFNDDGSIEGFRENQPYGGLVWPASADSENPGVPTGGWLPFWRYPPRKFGSLLDYSREKSEMARWVEPSRNWTDKAIRHKRDNLENQILKLMDLREQLLIERDQVFPSASGGVVGGIGYVEEAFYEGGRLPKIVNLIDQAMYDLDENGVIDLNKPRPSTINPAFPTLLEDAPTGEEDWTAFG